jgi:hypothetical protein
MARGATRAIVIFGARGADTKNEDNDLLNRLNQCGVRRIKTVSILSVLSPQRISAKRKQMPQVVENPSNSRKDKKECV